MFELSPGASVALGVFVGLLSTSIQSLGLTLQRKSHILEEEVEEYHSRRPPYRRRRWQLGMLMFIVANLVGSTIQITTLPLPVLSALQAAGLVFNSICATLILSEPFTRYSLAGTILVSTGAVIIGIFGALAEPSHNLDQLLALLNHRQFQSWFWVTIAVVLLIIGATWFLKRLHPHPTPRLRLVRGMCFGCVSGILSAHCLLVAKSAVELLVRTIIDRHNEFNRWQSWMILIGLVALALTQLYYLNRGLKLCSTSVLYPFVFCIYNIIAILDGLIYFRQTSRLPWSHALLIAVGTVILLSGVLALSWRLEDSEQRAGHVIVKAKPLAATPQAVLAPGMGMAHTTDMDEDGDSDKDESVALLRDVEIEQEFDEESGFRRQRASLPSLTHDAKGKRIADETTPLLRRSTNPAPSPVSRKRSGKRRENRNLFAHRSSTFSQADEIWDELNDRQDAHRSPRDPNSPIRSDTWRRSRSGTLPGRHGQGKSGYNRSRRKSWWGGMLNAKSATFSSRDGDPGADATTDDGEQTDGSSTVPTSPSVRPHGWGISNPRRKSNTQDGLGEWLKLKWKRRWRDNGEDGNNNDSTT